MLSFIWSWLLAFRLKTLTASFVPVLSAVGLACTHGVYHASGKGLNSYYVIAILVSAFSIQIATNLFNDAIDFKKGADKERRGPMRVTQSGRFTYQQVMGMACLFLLIALVFGATLVSHGGWPLVFVGLISLFLAYSYTGGPFPLAYLGLGDLFVLIFFGWIAVGMSYYLISLPQQWSLEALLLGYQVGALATVLIAINNLRDSDTDKAVSKRTLAVLLGDTFVRLEISGLVVSSLLIQVYWWFQYEISPLFFLPSILIGLIVVYRVWKDQKKEFLNKTLGFSALLQLTFGLSFYLAGTL